MMICASYFNLVVNFYFCQKFFICINIATCVYVTKLLTASRNCSFAASLIFQTWFPNVVRG